MMKYFYRLINRIDRSIKYGNKYKAIAESGLFDGEWYLQTYSDVKRANIAPIKHFILYGMGEMRAPSAYFDPSWYIKKYPDVLETDTPPLIHYINFGRQEGRLPVPPREDQANDVPLDLGADPASANVVYLKTTRWIGGGQWVLFISHTHSGAIKANVEPLLRAFKKNGVRIFLILAADRPVVVKPMVQDLCDQVLVRENAGYDFAAWSHVLRMHPDLFDADALYFVNDSIIGPSSDIKFGHLINRIYKSKSELLGLTESFEYGWHIQSYFFCLKPIALRNFFIQEFFTEVKSFSEKDNVIQAYETKFTSLAIRAGLDVEILFSGFEHSNPTVRSWDKLIEGGFPFIKTSVLRGADTNVDLSGWRSKAGAAGFDLDVIDAVLTMKQEMAPLSAPDARLTLAAAPIEPMPSIQALKIGFYGPWNYNSGLGVASRGLVSALRLTGVRLNLHPVKQGFHIHQRAAPAFDICDFEGDADVAIVHLNPEAWRLLTDHQRADIARARRVIGYWVWEMAHLPDDWAEDFTDVDRIWTPSAYCADVFKRSGAAFVDVIPHVVTVKDAPKASQRAELLKRLGLPETNRVILFVFDGSSYLVRKNPAALVRAFAASGLGVEGWSLVLKTKHLMDRPKEGAAFQSLVSMSESVLLIDAPLDQDALAELFAAADIYASPHASEGFGLTIAEAMAQGKVVVATDFGGSRDFLDKTNGFPVAAKATALEETFGHYKNGGVWGVIDEAELARALRAAAEEVQSPHPTLGLAAQRSVASKLSPSAVAERLIPSLKATLSAPSRAFRSERLRPGSAGILGAEAAFGPAFDVLMLDSDGTGVLRASTTVDEGVERWVIVTPKGVRLSPTLPDSVLRAARARPDVAIFYGDDVAFGEQTLASQLLLKPAFDRTLLASSDYVGSLIVVRADVLEKLGGLDAAFGSATVFEFLVRALDHGIIVDRIPEVLGAYDGARYLSDAGLRKQVLAKSRTFGRFVSQDSEAPGRLSLKTSFPDFPTVTILIKRREEQEDQEHVAFRRRLLFDRLKDVAWPADKLEVVVDVEFADAFAGAPFAFKPLDAASASEPVLGGWNKLWRAASNELLVLLDEGVQLIDPFWLQALMTFASDEAVGGVSGYVSTRQGEIVHAGVAGDLLGPFGFVWRGEPAHTQTYQSWGAVQREWSILGGGVLATRKSLLMEAAGFDDRLSEPFQTADLCLKLRALGYRMVYNPEAEFRRENLQEEARSMSASVQAAFLTRWKTWLKEDPAFHPELRKDRVAILPAALSQAWFI